jgi:hypothetical protein
MQFRISSIQERHQSLQEARHSICNPSCMADKPISRRIRSYVQNGRVLSIRITTGPRGIVSYRIVSYCIVLYRIVLYRIVSYRIVSYRIVSYRIVSYRIVSYRIVLYRTLSDRCGASANESVCYDSLARLAEIDPIRAQQLQTND